jgi:dephospho-CoA kinase
VLVLGIVGGVAAGKSIVAEEFERLGAARIDADRLGHDALRLPEVEAAARERWGDAIFTPEGRVDRQSLGAIVFGKSEEAERERRYLESLTHPRITQMFEIEKARYEKEGKLVMILDAPLLIEAGWANLCDEVIWIESTESDRLLRAKERGWSENEFRSREASQVSLEDKRRRAGCVIDNTGTRVETKFRVSVVWDSLLNKS